MSCTTCDNSGYLDINPVVYCDCEAGVFYEEKDELNGQIKSGDLDIGLCNVKEYVYDSDDCFDECMVLGFYRSNPDENIVMFDELPFSIS